MSELIYVQAPDKSPLMPTRRKRHTDWLLSHGRAKVVCNRPYTIRLKYNTDCITQMVTLGIDPGRTNIGLCAVDDRGEILFSAVCETRNKEVPKLMSDRASHRRASRTGERKARQRLAVKHGTVCNGGQMQRHLPQYGEGKCITCKYIKNSEARFSNRKRHADWLTPTVNQLVQTHVNLADTVKKYLPVTDTALEVNRFAFSLMEDPSISGVDFQNGPLKGFDDVNAAVSFEQHGKCLLCGGSITQYHHIKPRSRGGSNTLPNIAGVCDDCHDKVHKDETVNQRLLKLKKGLNKKYGALSALNQAIPFICREFRQKYAEHFHVTTGFNTSVRRNELGFLKTKDAQMHEVDAYCIATCDRDVITDSVSNESFKNSHTFVIKQFRRHNRAKVKSQTERTYFYEEEKVAVNRHKRIGQKTPSLYEWYSRQEELYGKEKADAMRSRLTVRKSFRRYNNPGRVLPGAVYIYEETTYVMGGQLTGGMYYYPSGDSLNRMPSSKCKVVKQGGFAFIS